MKIKTSYLIAAQAILFCLFLLTTFYFNRFAADDYYFIGELRTKPFSEIYSNLYFNWNGRWTYNFLVLIFLQLNTTFFLPLYNLISIGFLFAGIRRLLKAINGFYQFHFTRYQITVYTAISLSILFFCTIEPNDSWLWYTSSVAYLWSTIAFFWGVSVFFTQQKSTLDYLILFLSAIYIGGATEPLSIFIIISLIFLLYKKKNIQTSTIALIILSCSFLINYFSPGTAFRDELTPNLNIIDYVLYTGYGMLKFTFFKIYKTFIPALLLSIPFYLLGTKNKKQVIPQFNPLKSLSKSIAIVAAAVTVNQAMVIYVLGGLAPDRATISSSIIIAIVMIRYMFLLGSYHQKSKKSLKLFLFINVITLLCFNAYYFSTHLNYANAVDQRLANINQSKTNPIEVKPLPNSGYIYSAEITSDTSNFKNQHLKQGLDKDATIILQK